jgi:hypothetical protein
MSQIMVNEQFDRAVAEFAGNRTAIRRIRQIFTQFPDEFTISALRYLGAVDGDAGLHRCLVGMLLRQPAVLDQIADPALRTIQQAVRVTRRFIEVDPSFDVQLARRLHDASGLNHSTAFDSVRTYRVLEILDEASPGRRLLPVVRHLLESKDARVSARAVLFVGRREGVKWAERQLQRADSRVRANAIEGLWGLDSPDAVQLLESLARDGNNRVAGNALVGLHVTGKADVTEEIERLRQCEHAPSRSTAAWMMGRIGSAAFLEPLERLRRDENGVVRGAALRAMIEIRRLSLSVEPNLSDNKCVDTQGSEINGSIDGGSNVGTDPQPAGGEEVCGQRDGSGNSADSGNG